MQRLEQADESLHSRKLRHTIGLGQCILTVGSLDFGDEVVNRGEVCALRLGGMPELALSEKSRALALNRRILLLFVRRPFTGAVVSRAVGLRVCARSSSVIRHRPALRLQLLECFHLRASVRQPPVRLLLHRLGPARWVSLQIASFRQANLGKVDGGSGVGLGALGCGGGALCGTLLLLVLARIVLLCLAPLVRTQQLVPGLLVADQRVVSGHCRRLQSRGLRRRRLQRIHQCLQLTLGGGKLLGDGSHNLALDCR
mmetsp:Transcript_26257/g.58025  ORF Transcript_26257/g.58025 Transcript_26257/m.58025 type:complete len:256 (-) Transcript_26257:306-1073(-)